jgi:hypothetical protein
MIKLIFNIAKLQVKILVNRNLFANFLTTSFTATSKRDIMFSEKPNMMCSAQGFYKIKARFYMALLHHHVSMMGLTRRDDGSHRRR